MSSTAPNGPGHAPGDGEGGRARGRPAGTARRRRGPRAPARSSATARRTDSRDRPASTAASSSSIEVEPGLAGRRLAVELGGPAYHQRDLIVVEAVAVHRLRRYCYGRPLGLSGRPAGSTGTTPAPSTGPAAMARSTNRLAATQASAGSMPRASSAQMAADSTQPDPWVPPAGQPGALQPHRLLAGHQQAVRRRRRRRGGRP